MVGMPQHRGNMHQICRCTPAKLLIAKFHSVVGELVYLSLSDPSVMSL